MDSEAQQFERVCVLLEKDIVEALRVASSTLTSKKYFQDLLAGKRIRGC